MPNVQAPHLQSLASALPQLSSAFGAADKYSRDVAQALNSALVVGDSLQIFTPYTQSKPLAVPSSNALNFAEYKTTAGQSCTGGGTFNLINYDTAVVSNSNVTTGAAWKFTAPRSADYDVSCISTFTNTYTANTLVLGSLFVNGSDTYRGAVRNTGNSADFQAVGISTVVRLTAGQYIDWRAYNRSAGAVALDTNAANNWIRIRELMDDNPRVPSCFPFDVLWPKSYPPTVVLAQCADVNQTSPAAFALQLPDWGTVTKGGQTMIHVRNIPGLLASTSYAITLAVF